MEYALLFYCIIIDIYISNFLFLTVGANCACVYYYVIYQLTTRTGNMKFVTCLLLLSSTAVLCRAGALHGMLEGKENGNIWALLVAGSNTWMNYRHQVLR